MNFLSKIYENGNLCANDRANCLLSNRSSFMAVWGLIAQICNIEKKFVQKFWKLEN